MRIMFQKRLPLKGLLFTGVTLLSGALPGNRQVSAMHLPLHAYENPAPPLSPSQVVTIISGTVQDEKGTALAGATISVKGMANLGTTTDGNGRFSLRIPDNVKDPVLVISYIGFQSQAVAIGNKTNLTIQLESDHKALNEVVVVGFGQQKLPTVTGEISVVDSKALLQTPVANITNMLIGRAAGISGIQNSGEPGQNATTIRIRGISTLNGSDPLIVIDGIQQPTEQPYTVLNAMDPNEIDNISVLKDASATAVFGIRGANGVIIVTTKRGRANRPQFSFSTNQAFTRASSLFETLNSYEFGLLRNEAVRNAQASGDNSYNQLLFSNDELWKFQNNRDYTPAEVNAMNLTADQKQALLNSPALYYTSNNYYKEQFGGVGRQQQYNLNVSGGTNRVKYFVSLGNFQQAGILNNTKYGGSNTNPYFNRYNFRSNVDIDVFKNFQVSFNMAGQTSIAKVPGAGNSSGDFGNRYQNIIQSILENSPFSGPGIVDGRLVTGFVGLPGDPTNPVGSKGGGGYTPLTQLLTAGTRTMYTTTLTSNFVVKHTMGYITPGLSSRVSVAYDDSYTKGFAKTVSVPQFSAMRNPSDPANLIFIGGQISPTSTADNVGNGSWNKLYLEAAIDYNHSFGDHTVTGLILGNAQRFTANGQGYNTPSGLMGLVGRVTYNFKERYLFEFNMGFNGSEQFAPGRRFGYFPSVSPGWILSNESFFPKNDLVTWVKFRGSYGEVGNDQLGGRRYLYLPNTWAYNGRGYYFGRSDGSSANPYFSGAQETALGNPAITWERARKTNLAAEFRFLKDRLTVNTALFWENRNNILVSLGTIPGTYGVPDWNVPPANVGRVSNRGYELFGEWNDKVGAVQYFVRGTFSYARNRIDYRAEAPYPYPWMNSTGYSIGQYKGLRTDGFYNTQEELSNRPYNTFGGNQAKLGDIKFRDINGDGILNNQDLVPIGYSNLPRVAYNFSVGLSYKGFDINALFIGTKQGSFPQYGYILSTPFAKNVGAVMQYAYDGRWTPEKYAAGQPIYYPTISFSGGQSNNNQLSDFWLKSNDFTRLKNLEVGYTFQQNNSFLKATHLQGVRLYVNGNNLFTWGSHLINGIDPEQADTGKNSMGYLYPLTRTFNIGASIQF
ncbi:hypothetical protein BWI96_07440 [Siphonobacter sp. SORGH_AS_0500]|nr:hypothetical protein BWI96_07440 [Siphonobacter sp. SORGH_AS_0500]